MTGVQTCALPIFHDIEDDIRQADILVVECVERLDDSLNGTILQLIDILENKGKST